MTANSRISILATCAGAFAAGAAFLFPGVASADPQEQDSSTIVNTTCTVEQIDSATQHEAPKFWEHISSDPDKLQKAHERLQEFLDKSPEERQEALQDFKSHAQDWVKEHPDKAKQAQDHKDEMRATFHRIFDTCDQY